MAWNEPGKGQDPWGGGRNNGSGPPDLDQLWRRFRARLSKGGGNGNGNGGGSGGGSGPNPALLLWLIPVIAVIWLLTGFFVVQPGAQGVILRFGSYVQTANPGWHWYWPYPVGEIIRVDTQQVRSASTRGIVLTKDESLAELEVSLQYRVKDPMNYLFQLTNPDLAVEHVLKSAVREVVGTSRLNQVIQEGVRPEALEDEAVENVDLKKTGDDVQPTNPMQDLPEATVEAVHKQQANYPEITDRSRALLPVNVNNIVQTTLDHYQAGVHVIAVNVQYAQPPEPVQSAFEEAIKAREEKERKQNIARAYARQILAQATGQTAEIIAQARAYKASKVSEAQGDASRFTQVAKQFELAPEVTRRRLYLETMGEVLGTARLVLTEKGDDGPMMYLPLPGMQDGARPSPARQNTQQTESDLSSMTDNSSTSPTASNSGSSSNSNNLRSRGRN